MASLQFRPTALGTQGETNGLRVPSPEEYRGAERTQLGMWQSCDLSTLDLIPNALLGSTELTALQPK